MHPAIKKGLLIIGLVFSCQTNENNLPVSEDLKEFPEQEGWNSTLTLSKAGDKQAVVQYGHMVKFKAEDTVYLNENVEVDFFNDTGQHTSRLVSERAEIEEKKQNVRAIDNVVVVSDSGVTLKTEYLEWNSTLEKIHSDSLVMIVTQYQDTLFGKGFEAESDLSRRVIHEPWGVTDRRVNLEKFEQGFKKHSQKLPSDSVQMQNVNGDSVNVE